MENEDFLKFLRRYGDMNKFDLITEIISKYDDKSYFKDRKVWVKRTRGELLAVIFEDELIKEKI